VTGTRPRDGSCWRPIDGLPGASLLMPAAPGSPARTVLSALRDTMPSRWMVAKVTIGVITASFLVIFIIASVLYVRNGLGF
jgi:hypothetical protein